MGTTQTQTVTAETGSLAKWASWLAALIGLWVLVSPFVLGGSIAGGTAMWSNVVSGAAIVVLAIYGAFVIRRTTGASGMMGQMFGWFSAIFGVLIASVPFGLAGPIGEGMVMRSNVVLGALVVVLAAYAGYVLHTRE